MQDKLLTVLWADEMLTLGKLRGSWLQLLQSLGITAGLWDLLWDDTPPAASLNPPENCSSDGQPKNVPVNVLFTQSWVELTSPEPPQ